MSSSITATLYLKIIHILKRENTHHTNIFHFKYSANPANKY